jgi:trehalose 6-phosphate synthase/phosphatase
MDRTPGSFIEEKNYSLVWHYRTADPDLASVRVVELRESLLNLTENLNVGILEGSKVIEVKTSGINKGTAGLHWLSRTGWQFILAVGDDITDENTFEVLPSHAYSIKVGLEMTKARYSVLDVALLDELAGAIEA